MFSQVAQITDSLYLCGAAARRPEKLRELNITFVINATMDVPNLKEPGIEYAQIHIDDVPHAQLYPYFDRVADKIHQVTRRGGKTLVHCIAGVSRSASLVMCYLMKYQRMTLRGAYDHTKQRRPVIRPNVGFWKQMIDYEKSLYGVSSVKMVHSPIGHIPDVYKEETKNMVW